MPMAEFRVGQRVYYCFPPSGGEQTWYGYIIEVTYEWGVWVYNIQFDGITTPQKYSNTEEAMLIWSDDPMMPTWEV